MDENNNKDYAKTEPEVLLTLVYSDVLELKKVLEKLIQSTQETLAEQNELKHLHEQLTNQSIDKFADRAQEISDRHFSVLGQSQTPNTKRDPLTLYLSLVLNIILVLSFIYFVLYM